MRARLASKMINSSTKRLLQTVVKRTFKSLDDNFWANQFNSVIRVPKIPVLLKGDNSAIENLVAVTAVIAFLTYFIS
jgi:hypothetical protein